MAYRDFKDLTRRTASDKILRDKPFETAKNLKYDEYQKRLASMVYIFFDKKSALLVDKSASGRVIKNENMSNKELAEELHKPINRKFRKRKVYSSVKDNIWGTGLADIQLISTFNKAIPFLLCVIDIFNKHA